MTLRHAQEISANLERAEASLQAAKELFAKGFFDVVASRAYYAAFYAVTTLLLTEELEFNKHSGAIAAIHQRWIKTGRLAQDFGKDLNWLFELRNVGD